MDKECTIYQTTDMIGKKWTLLILLELYRGKNKWKRYSELKKGIPDITPKILSSRLKELMAGEVIEKRVDASKVPVKSEYSLTKSGQDFIKIIQDIKKWALKWKIKNKICSNCNCKKCIL